MVRCRVGNPPIHFFSDRSGRYLSVCREGRPGETMFVLIALLASFSFTVRLVDPTGAPIPNASVSISTRDSRVRVQVRTDVSGTVDVPVTTAEAILLIEAEGFAPLTRVLTTTEQKSTLQLTLALAGVADRVVVTASGDLQTADEVAKSLNVVDAQSLEARQEFSVVDAMRMVPGVSVQQLGGPGAFTSIKLRGLREQDTAVLIDGVRFRDAGAPQGDATGFLGELYLTNLDRIEVLRGSGSSLYGSHAVGGAINLITRRGSSTLAGKAGIEAGGLGFTRVDGHVGGGTAGGRARFSLGAGDTRTSKGIDGDDRAVNSSAQGRADLRVAAAASVTLRAYVSDAESKVNESPGAIGPLPSTGIITAKPFATFTPSLNDPDNVRDSGFVSTLVQFEQRATSRFGYSTSLHRLTTSRTYRDGPLGVSAFEPLVDTRSVFKGTLDTFTSRADLDWTAEHTTTVGYELEREQFVSESVPENRAATWGVEIVQTSQSVSLQQQMRLPAVTVAISARAQMFAIDRPAFMPADRAPFTATAFATPPAAVTADLSAARWIAGTGTKVRAHIGNAYRAPSMYERAGSSFSSRGYTLYGDPRLGPERSIAFDAGLDQTLVAGRVRASATWYRARLQRVIAFGSIDRATDPFGRSSGYLLADGRVAHGVELSASIAPTPVTRFDVAYTFANADAPAGDRDGLPRASAIVAHQLSFLLIQRVRQAVQLSFELEAAGDHYLALFDPVSFASRAYEFAGTIKADVGASYAVGIGHRRIRFAAVVDNLFDREQFVQGFRTSRRTGRAGVALLF
jgi:vitamin B12 transporter